MKNLFLGILLIIIAGIGGLVYRNAAEHPSQPIACPMDALVCPDGTSVARIGSACTFAVCPPPNVSLPDISISFAIPDGFTESELPDATAVAAYEMPAAASSTGKATLLVRHYAVTASSTGEAVMRQTAIGGASGMPVSATSFTSTSLNGHRFTIVSIERFEGTIDTAYYLVRPSDVVRFDAIDTGMNWSDPNLVVAKLPAHAALLKLLATLEGK